MTTKFIQTTTVSHNIKFDFGYRYEFLFKCALFHTSMDYGLVESFKDDRL